LLDEARSALAQGDPARALERLQRHRQSFPMPLLGEERDAMWVSALVKAGRYDEARTRAEAFRRRFPDSLFASMVDTAIASIP
jgi:outer membrane protein assembly factor BamD (BamD/ComL family)